MTRRRSWTAAAVQRQREAARAEAARQRAAAAAQREAERARAAYQRATAAEQREWQRLYAASRAADVAALNEELDHRIDSLHGLLATTLTVDDYIEFESLKQPAVEPAWTRTDLEQAKAPAQIERFLPPPPSGLLRAGRWCIDRP